MTEKQSRTYLTNLRPSDLTSQLEAYFDKYNKLRTGGQEENAIGEVEQLVAFAEGCIAYFQQKLTFLAEVGASRIRPTSDQLGRWQDVLYTLNEEISHYLTQIDQAPLPPDLAARLNALRPTMQAVQEELSQFSSSEEPVIPSLVQQSIAEDQATKQSAKAVGATEAVWDQSEERSLESAIAELAQAIQELSNGFSGIRTALDAERYDVTQESEYADNILALERRVVEYRDAVNTPLAAIGYELEVTDAVQPADPITARQKLNRKQQIEDLLQGADVAGARAKITELEDLVWIKRLVLNKAWYREGRRLESSHFTQTTDVVADVSVVAKFLRDVDAVVLAGRADLSSTDYDGRNRRQTFTTDFINNLAAMVDAWVQNGYRRLISQFEGPTAYFNQFRPSGSPASFITVLGVLETQLGAGQLLGADTARLQDMSQRLSALTTLAQSEVLRSLDVQTLLAKEPRLSEFIETYWSRSAAVAQAIAHELTDRDKAEALEQERADIYDNIIAQLRRLSQRSNFLIDQQRNEVEQEHERVVALFNAYKTKNPPENEMNRLERQMVETFYKIYRRKLLHELDEHESENVGWRSVPFKGVFEDKILDPMQNLLEEYTKLDEIGSITDMEQQLKTENSPQGIDALLQRLDPSIDLRRRTAMKDMLLDFFTLRKEYLTRKFLRISWSELQPKSIMPPREYPQAVDADVLPITYMVNYFLREGLQNTPGTEFGKETNQVIDPNRRTTIKSVTQHNTREQHQYRATLNGEIWRALDSWAKGDLKFSTREKVVPTTSNIHTEEGVFVQLLADYLKQKYPRITIDNGDVLRAYRIWALTTFHQSARAATSAEGPDGIYYQHKFHEYNYKYDQAGTASWYPLLTQMLFSAYDVNGRFLNPLEFLWGDDELVRDKRPIIEKIIPFSQGYGAMMRALEEKGFLTPSHHVEEEHGFDSYNFLRSPLLVMPNMSQDTNRKKDELFAIQPVLASLFMTDARGRTIRYPDVIRNGEVISQGRAVSLMDYQDSEGGIIYEQLPIREKASRLHSVIASLGTNGAKFLNDFLKSNDIVSKLENALVVANFKNNAKYVMPHLPQYGTDIASDLYADDREAADRLKLALMNMLIAQIVFVVCIIKIDTGNHDHWSILQVEQFLQRLVVNSRAISSHTAEAIFTAIKGAQKYTVSVASASEKIREQVEQRFRYSDSRGGKH